MRNSIFLITNYNFQSEIEKSEYGEKVIRHEAKKLSREQKRLERKQRKLQWKRQFTTASSKFQSTSDNPSELNDAEKALSNSRMVCLKFTRKFLINNNFRVNEMRPSVGISSPSCWML